jgi:hypothetical protein
MTPQTPSRGVSPNSTATFPVDSGFISEGIKRPAKYLHFSGNLSRFHFIVSNEEHSSSLINVTKSDHFARSPKPSGVGFSAGDNNIHVEDGSSQSQNQMRSNKRRHSAPVFSFPVSETGAPGSARDGIR